MKVVHLTTSSRGGAGIAALRLHEALREVGVVSAFVSTDCTINFEGEKISDSFLNTEGLPSGNVSYAKFLLLRKIVCKIVGNS